jgi:asparagine synthase (glutamine-hydrolysing)
VMALAREHGAKVLLDGQGGDEVLAGYKYYVAARLADELGGGHPVRWMRHLAAARRNALLPAGWLLRATAGELRRRGRTRERLRAEQLEDVRDHLPALLHYEDRSSMAFSIEARLPFLDYRFVELGLALPGEAKIDDGWTKLALRRAFDADLPAEVVWRRDKVQFSVAQDAWLTGPLRELTSDLFASAGFAAREGVDAAALRGRLAADGLSASEADLIWRHLSLELWYRAYVDSPRARAEPLAAGR